MFCGVFFGWLVLSVCFGWGGRLFVDFLVFFVLNASRVKPGVCELLLT